MSKVSPGEPSNAAPDSCVASTLLDTIKHQAELVLSELGHGKAATLSLLPSDAYLDTEDLYNDDRQLARVAAAEDNHRDVDFLSAVLVNKPLCTTLSLRADDIHRTMRICEGLTINFLHDLGDSDQGVCSCPVLCSSAARFCVQFLNTLGAMHADSSERKALRV